MSGIGPKVALAIVSGSPPAELRRAIARDDLARFEAIPGIGRKTAQRVVMELKDKLGDPVAARLRPAARSWRATRSSSSAGRVIDADRALADVDESLTVEEQVRSALKQAA